MSARIAFTGPAHYRIRSASQLIASAIEVSARRALRGRRYPQWNWTVEAGCDALGKLLNTAFELNVEDARSYLDSITIHSPFMNGVTLNRADETMFSGTWFTTNDVEDPITLLYFHGGGYSFYPKSYEYFISLITLAAKSKTFALDYRLAPEHLFPAQLEDALNAYGWLLKNGTDPDRLVVAGDSAGGHLAITLLLSIRDAGLAAPALAIALSPATDFGLDQIQPSSADWISEPMLGQWRDWFCKPEQRRKPLVSPVHANLGGLAEIYIQAGTAEILFPSIKTFVDHARNHGTEAVLESWKGMPHVFQLFGFDSPQSADALRRISEVIETRVRGTKFAAPSSPMQTEEKGSNSPLAGRED